MTEGWLCPQCGEENGELNGFCEWCYVDRNIKIYNPDRYYIREIKIYHIEKDVMSMNEQEKGKTKEEILAEIDASNMTPQEKAHAKFFNHGVFTVRDMMNDDLAMDAWIEELAAICFEGRSTHQGATAERSRIREKTKRAQGFEKSLRTDEASTAALNTIKERQKKLTKAEKVAEGLRQLFGAVGEHFGVAVDAKAEAEKAMSARNMAGVVKSQNHTPIESTPQATFNPFARKREESQNVQAAIDSILATPAEEKKPIGNPFLKENK